MFVDFLFWVEENGWWAGLLVGLAVLIAAIVFWAGKRSAGVDETLAVSGGSDSHGSGSDFVITGFPAAELKSEADGATPDVVSSIGPDACAQTLTSPDPSSISQPETSANPVDSHSSNSGLSREQLRELLLSLQGNPPRRRLSFFYMVALFCVAVAMLLLPCIYLAFVGAAGYGVYWHATAHLSIATSNRITLYAKMYLYAAPLVAGVVLFIFLLKPLFARRVRNAPLLAITEQDDPMLFALVKQICSTLGAPMPRRIEVTCDANAGAYLAHGIWSVFRPGDVALVIGLPLVAALDVACLAEVIAHELGHFTQGTGMRLHWIIGRINSWFAEVVYGRDTWDADLNSIIHACPAYFRLLFTPARAGIKLSRALLKGLLYTSDALSCALTRQQEYDADRMAAYVVGSHVFARSSNAIIKMNVASEVAQSWLHYGLRKMVLPANYTELCGAIAVGVSREDVAWFRQARRPRFPILETHPSDFARDKAVKKENLQGIFHPPPAAASILFHDFEGLCRKASVDFYSQSLNKAAVKRMLCSTPEFVDKVKRLSHGTGILEIKRQNLRKAR
jgi:Zn-dependent protease with chaperone function